MDNLHRIQMLILRELLFKPSSTFTDLNISGLSNDHFSYHIRTLVKIDFVLKGDNGYSLTLRGKEFANRMDTDSNKVERQPKISVLIIPEKKLKGKTQYLIQTRTKEPYFGYSGFMTGKIRYGEKVFEAATRELEEEMGLEADFEYSYILHEMVYDKTGKMLEDKFFHVLGAANIRGQLKKETPDGKNSWISGAGFKKMTPKFHNEDEILDWYKSDDKTFKEKSYVIEGF